MKKFSRVFFFLSLVYELMTSASILIQLIVLSIEQCVGVGEEEIVHLYNRKYSSKCSLVVKEQDYSQTAMVACSN